MFEATFDVVPAAYTSEIMSPG